MGIGGGLSRSSRLVMAIGGEDRTGRSVVAHRLAEGLRLHCLSWQMVFRGWAAWAVSARLNLEVDGDWQRMLRVVRGPMELRADGSVQLDRQTISAQEQHYWAVSDYVA